MVKKTRDKFIEVARQLFARKGVENTTMNDIASASDKGRRTIYTYFKSKGDIFRAVVESESEELLCRLRKIVALSLPPEEKLEAYIRCRLETMKEIVLRNGSLRAVFFRDVRKVDRARWLISQREIALLSEIIREGNALGVFDIENVNDYAIIISNAIYGMDVPYIRDALSEYGINKDKIIRLLCQMILNGILSRQ